MTTTEWGASPAAGQRAGEHMERRITVYRDPLSDRQWIVALDAGDPSQERVLSEHRTHAVAIRQAAREARGRGCAVHEETVTLR